MKLFNETPAMARHQARDLLNLSESNVSFEDLGYIFASIRDAFASIPNSFSYNDPIIKEIMNKRYRLSSKTKIMRYGDWADLPLPVAVGFVGHIPDFYNEVKNNAGSLLSNAMSMMDTLSLAISDYINNRNNAKYHEVHGHAKIMTLHKTLRSQASEQERYFNTTKAFDHQPLKKLFKNLDEINQTVDLIDYIFDHNNKLKEELVRKVKAMRDLINVLIDEVKDDPSETSSPAKKQLFEVIDSSAESITMLGIYIARVQEVTKAFNLAIDDILQLEV